MTNGPNLGHHLNTGPVHLCNSLVFKMLGIQIPTVYDLKMFNSIKNHKSLAKVDTAIRQEISHIFNKEFYKQNTDFLAFTLV